MTNGDRWKPLRWSAKATPVDLDLRAAIGANGGAVFVGASPSFDEFNICGGRETENQ
jgi:hypothetical protein